MNFFSNIYFRMDAGAAYLPGHPVHSIVLQVDGAGAVEPFMMILPTDAPKSIDITKIAGWLASLNGPGVDACCMSASQRELLLTLVCGYRAFLEIPPGVKVDDFYEFAHKLIDAASELTALQPADTKMREIADWLEGRLPATCFMPVLDSGYEPRNPENLSKDDITSIITTFASMLDPRVRDVIQEIDVSSILAATPTPPEASPTPPSATTKSKSRNARKKARKARKAAAAADAVDGVSSDVHADAIDSVQTFAGPPPSDARAAPSTPVATAVAVEGVRDVPASQSIGTFAGVTGSAAIDTVRAATRAVTVEEVPDVDVTIRRAPVLDVKGKGSAAVLELISSDSEDELPGLVDVQGSSDEEDSEDEGARVDLVRVLTDLARQ